MIRLQIETHDGITDVVEVKDYNSLKVVNAINDSQNEHVIAFGDFIYSKINIKTIKPIKEDEEAGEEVQDWQENILIK